MKQARSDLEDAESSKVTKDHAFQQLQMEKDEALEEVTALQQKLQERELKMLVINEAVRTMLQIYKSISLLVRHHSAH